MVPSNCALNQTIPTSACPLFTASLPTPSLFDFLQHLPLYRLLYPFLLSHISAGSSPLSDQFSVIDHRAKSWFTSSGELLRVGPSFVCVCVVHTLETIKLYHLSFHRIPSLIIKENHSKSRAYAYTQGKQWETLLMKIVMGGKFSAEEILCLQKVMQS